VVLTNFDWATNPHPTDFLNEIRIRFFCLAPSHS